MYEPPKRKPIPKRVRIAVYAKCNGHCAYCGTPIEMRQMQVDHVIPFQMIERYADTGKDLNAIENLLPACRSCNHYKHTLSLEEFRDAVWRWPEVLMRDSVTHRNAVRFGQVTPTPHEVVFYFEREESI